MNSPAGADLSVYRCPDPARSRPGNLGTPFQTYARATHSLAIYPVGGLPRAHLGLPQTKVK